MVERAVAVIEGTKLVAVGEVSAVTVPSNAELIDVSGTTLVPGFLDAHVHIGFVDPGEVARRGVTTVRDLGWPLERIVELARDTNGHRPAIYYAGPMLTVEGGYPTRAAWAPPGTGLVVDGPRSATEAVRRLAGAGVSVIKVALNEDVGPTLDLATLKEIVTAAHAAGLKVTTHANGIAQLEKAIVAGVDELAHMLMGLDVIPRATIDRMIEAGMTVVPTLAIRTGDELAAGIENVSGFVAAGGRVIYGTDLGNEGPLPGIDVSEIDAMRAAGMTGVQIVRSGTVDAAEWLGLPSKGVLEPGADADVITVGGDPLTDPRKLVDVRRVWVGGREIPTAS
jgi:imidazolonepropionase-like amidohydrolase